MRTCLAISILVHAAVMLWLALVPGRPFAPVQAEAILVDLLPAQDAPREAKAQEPALKPEPQKPPPDSGAKNSPKSDNSKSDNSKSDNSKSDTSKSDTSKSDKTAQDEVEDRAAIAARPAWELVLPTDTAVSLAAPPGESKSSLTAEQIAALKAQVSKCWVMPEGAPRTAGFEVLLRIGLRPDGRLAAPPELISAPASRAGPPLVMNAKQALDQCQPYAMLPADKYQDWKVLDLSFTTDGPTGLSAPTRRNAATH
jgi:hypothetical protein